VEEKESIIRQNVLLNSTLDPLQKTKTLTFLGEVKNYLLQNISNMSNMTNTSIIQPAYHLESPLVPSSIVESASSFIIQPYKENYKLETGDVNTSNTYYPGKVNPLNKTVIKRSLNIDTRFRDNYGYTLSSDFQFDLPINLTKVISMSLTSFEFPSVYYNIAASYQNNFFSYSSTLGGAKTWIIIPDGVYTIQQIAELCTGVTFTIDSSQNKITLGNGLFVDFLSDPSGNPTVNTQLTLPTRLGWLLGLRNPTYPCTCDVSGSTPTASSSGYTSEGLYDVFGMKYVYLAVDDYNNSVNNSFYSAFNNSVLNNNILSKISLQGTNLITINSSTGAQTTNNILNIANNQSLLANNQLNFTNSTREYFGPVDIKKLHIQLLDEFGRVVNLMNMDYSFCLTFGVVYYL
jgi:hypothetical protein